MDEQLPQIALAQRRHPDARKGILLIRHQPKNMLRIPLVVLLLAHRRGANRGSIADPQFVPQLLQQPLEPLRVAGSFDAHANRLRQARIKRARLAVLVFQSPLHHSPVSSINIAICW